MIQSKHHRDPVELTCPAIDEMQKDNHMAISDIEEAMACAKQGLDRIIALEYQLENLRNANQALREWATEEAEAVDEHEEQVVSLNTYIDELESDKTGYIAEVDHLTSENCALEQELEGYRI